MQKLETITSGYKDGGCEIDQSCSIIEDDVSDSSSCTFSGRESGDRGEQAEPDKQRRLAFSDKPPTLPKKPSKPQQAIKFGSVSIYAILCIIGTISVHNHARSQCAHPQLNA